MSPIFEGDQAKTNVLSEPLPPGIYTCTVESPTIFHKAKDDGSTIVAVQYPLRVTQAPDGKGVGRTIRQSCWLHSDGGRKMSKQFIMACHGYKQNRTGQEQFNDYILGLPEDADRVDTDQNWLGEYWTAVVGSEVTADVEIQLDKKGIKQQNIKRFLLPGSNSTGDAHG